jgi:hypothetical protein
MQWTTTIYAEAALLVSALVVFGGILVRARPRSNENLLDAIVERQSPGSGRGRETGMVPDRGLSKGPRLSVLEGHLRTAILSPQARERLVEDAMRTAGGNRAAGIRKVLSDLHAENNRWS